MISVFLEGDDVTSSRKTWNLSNHGIHQVGITLEFRYATEDIYDQSIVYAGSRIGRVLRPV